MSFANELKQFGLSPVKSMVASTHELFRLPLEKINKYKGYLIAETFRYHYENNEFYRDLCNKKGVTPDQVQGYDDLIKIPLIPVNTFKQCNSHVLLTADLSQIEFEMRSTGTSGIPSVSRRDRITMDNASNSINMLYREFFAISRGMGLFLFPSAEEMPEMGMVKALNFLAGLLDGSVNLVKQLSFDPDKAIQYLKEWEGKHTRHIIGPPFLIYRLLRYCINNDIRLKLEKKSYVITLGGWKRFTGQEIPRSEFDQLCAEYFGINPKNVRDMYGLVEANMLTIECEEQEKHVPPWAHISLRNPKNIEEEVAFGERGVIAIYDPTCLSYPGFIITEDVGYFRKHTSCQCGRNGELLVYVSRLPGVEVGCCAVNLERYIEEQEKKIAERGEV